MANENAEWSLSEEFWEGVGDLMFDPARVEKAGIEVAQIIELLGVSGGRVVDLCCGAGRHAVEFARRGYEVIGVDLTKHFLETAAKAARDAEVEVELAHADVRDYRCDPPADFALNLWTSFGYFERDADNLAVLRSAYDSLRAGGRFVLQTRAVETLAATLTRRTWWERDGRLFLEEREVIDGWRRLKGRWIVVDQQGRRDFPYSGSLYSSDTITRMLKSVGFRSVDLYGDLAGGPFDMCARHLVAISNR